MPEIHHAYNVSFLMQWLIIVLLFAAIIIILKYNILLLLLSNPHVFNQSLFKYFA